VSGSAESTNDLARKKRSNFKSRGNTMKPRCLLFLPPYLNTRLQMQALKNNFPIHLCAVTMFFVFAWASNGNPALAAEVADNARERKLNAPYALLVQPATQVEATYSVTLTAPDLNAREWILIGAIPPQMTRQKAEARFVPQAERTDDLSEAARKIFRARVPANRKPLKTSVTSKLIIRAQLYATQVVPNRRGIDRHQPDPLSDAERSRFLRNTSKLDFENADFQAWKSRHQLKRNRGENQVDFAQRVFLHIRSSMTYEYHNQMDRKVTFVCKKGKSDCGGLSNLLVATLRSEGIPARLVVGRWAMSATPGATVGDVPFYQQHAKAEFYAEGVGWVPVDMASGILHDRSQDGLRYFGKDEGDFITMHFDSDLKVDTVYFGEQSVESLQGINFWVTGSGSLDGLKTDSDWQVVKK